jgi:drug/metabolite transporter (DMT)-like permease
MNRIHRIRRLAGLLAGLAGVLLASAPAAFAEPLPPPDCCASDAATGSVTLITGGGMPGWQITLIAVGAALLAATVAVLLDRAWAARRRTITTAA